MMSRRTPEKKSLLKKPDNNNASSKSTQTCFGDLGMAIDNSQQLPGKDDPAWMHYEKKLLELELNQMSEKFEESNKLLNEKADQTKYQLEVAENRLAEAEYKAGRIKKKLRYLAGLAAVLLVTTIIVSVLLFWIWPRLDDEQLRRRIEGHYYEKKAVECEQDLRVMNSSLRACDVNLNGVKEAAEQCGNQLQKTKTDAEKLQKDLTNCQETVKELDSAIKELKLEREKEEQLLNIYREEVRTLQLKLSQATNSGTSHRSIVGKFKDWLISSIFNSG